MGSEEERNAVAFSELYLSVHPRADLEEIATEWVRYPASLRELEATSRDPRAREYPTGIPTSFRPYDGRAYQQLMPRRLHDVFMLVMKGLGKVRNVDVDGRPKRGERLHGIWLGVHSTLQDMIRYGIPGDASVINVLQRLVWDLPKVEYDNTSRATERGKEIVDLVVDMQRVGETSLLTTSRPLVESIGRVLSGGDTVGVVEVTEGLNVLDIGCGDGSITRDVCRRLGASRCCGVDVYPPEHTVEGVEYVQIAEGDREYPFEDEGFDVVLLMEVLHHIPSDTQVLSILRKVRRGGIVVVKEHDVRDQDTALYLDIRHGLDEVLLDGKSPEEYATTYYARYMPRRVMEGLFRHGFRQLRIRDPYSTNPSNPMRIYHAIFKRL